jgi:hypothetical protein
MSWAFVHVPRRAALGDEDVLAEADPEAAPPDQQPVRSLNRDQFHLQPHEGATKHPQPLLIVH